MNSFADHLREHRRLVVLRLLAELPEYRTNDSVLCGGCNQLGVVSSRDDVRTDLAWLAEQGLVELQIIGAVTVVTLATRGLDVAEGRARVPGIQRPSPRPR